MKKKNGFTLVELIVVIAILGVILLLVVPNVLSILQSGKKDAFLRQVQTVWKESEKQFSIDFSKEIDNYLYSDSVSNLGRKLDLNKTDITYVASFDEDGELVYIAVGNKEYCYINTNPQDIEISKDTIIDGFLTCDSSGCSCGSNNSSIPSSGGNNNYVYWDSDVAYGLITQYLGSSNYTFDGNVYLFDNYPSNAKTSYTSLKTYFIRTTIGNDGRSIKHEACYHNDSDIYCYDKNYYENVDTTLNRLRNSNPNAYNTYCMTPTSIDGTQVVYCNFYFNSYSNRTVSVSSNYISVHDDYDSCALQYVNGQWYAYCYVK